MMLEEITETLSDIDAPGTFAVRHYLKPKDLQLEVKGVGRIPLPVSATSARKLCKIGRKAPFGLREKTLIDARIRDTWQIAKSRVKLDKQRFKKLMAPALEAIQAALGLGQGQLSAELYKMLVYEPGQFFVPHQDSEKSDDMVGTLLLELPSDYSGGTVSIEHRDQQMTFRRTKRSGKDVTLLAFYADCHHEVKPIKKGYRVVLSFNLRFRGSGLPTTVPASSLDTLTQQVQSHFSTVLPPNPYDGTPQGRPQRLVYLLDHEYTQKSLGWHRLKNGDRARVAALRAVAKKLDCVAFLTLADVHEHWACMDHGWDYRGRNRYGRRYYDEYDDEEYDLDEDDDDHDEKKTHDHLELTELLDGDIELRHWISEKGKLSKELVSSNPSPEEICFTIPTEDLEPFKSEHEGWMGNYGNTVERWYHRAALVMWPRALDFIVRAEIAPTWAQAQILKQSERGEHQQAKKRAEATLPFWKSTFSDIQRPHVFRKALHLARLLNDAELAAQWLHPFRLDQLSPRQSPQLGVLLTHYGLAWVQARISQWGSTHFDPEQALDKTLVELCAYLQTARSPDAQQLGQWLVEREADILVPQWDAVMNAAYINVQARHKRMTELMTHAGHFFEAAAITQSPTQRDRVIASLIHADKPVPALTLGELLQTLRERLKPKAIRAMGIEMLYQHTKTTLENLTAKPPRTEDDWSMTPPPHCTCADCRKLATFLRALDKTSMDWPLAQARRRHIHDIIDSNNLPVKHTTRRQGSPFKLMLRKLPALFEQDAKLRARRQTLLSWLNKQRRTFTSPT